MRSILVHADGGPATEVRLQAALDIARLTGGHVTVHVNTPLQRFVAMDPFGGSYLLTDAIAEEQLRESELIERLKTKLATEDVPWDIESSNVLPGDALARAASLADVAILSLNRTPGQPDGDAAALVGDVTVAARCPVLAIPADVSPLFITGTAMVAWGDRPEAATALRAAVPLLARAAAVKIVTVTDRHSPSTAIDAAHYLSRHDIHAEVIEKPAQATIEETLEAAANSLGAAWIVMGAYGHSRLRESMFGGVTRYFLDAGRFPLLLSH